jgi:fucose permease
LQLRATVLSAIVFILYCGLEAATGAWLYTLLHEGRNVSMVTAGTAVSLFWGSLMAARIVFGLVPAREPLSRWLFASMSVSLLATLGLSLASQHGVSIAAGALIGFACGPIFPWLIAETPRRLGVRHGANAIGVQVASAAVGLAIAPALVGVLAERHGVNAIPHGLVALAVLLLIAFGALERCRA